MNAHSRPEFEGQLVKFRSPAKNTVVLLDEARRNEKYGHLEWCAVNPDHPEYSEKLSQATWDK